MRDGNWILLPVSFVEEWSLDKCREEASAIANNLYGDMIDYGAVEETDLIGYITVGTKRLGTKGQYVQLVTFQVLEPFRGMGVGRKLFEKAAGAAKGHGAKKLYISADGQRDIEQLAARIMAKKSFTAIINMTYSCRVGFGMMHNGSYDDEPATVTMMHEFLEQEGYELDITNKRLHHEIYLSDARKVAPEKLKTVIRHPIKTKGD